jgi:NAD+ kinase
MLHSADARHRHLSASRSHRDQPGEPPMIALAPFRLERSGPAAHPIGVLRTPDHTCDEQLGAVRAWAEGIPVEVVDLGTAARVVQGAPACQAIVALGGDGTILRAMRLGMPAGVPVLGVNFGRVGFLADVGASALAEALDALAAGLATVEERSTVELQAPEKSVLAANDVALARSYGQGPARLELTMAGVPLSPVVGDGIIFASPGGSTAHNLTAGGPVLSPRLRALVLRTLSARAPMPGALVLHADEPVTVRAAQDGPELTIEADGQVVGDLEPGAEATVRVPDVVARVLRTRPPHFFGELAERLARPFA